MNRTLPEKAPKHLRAATKRWWRQVCEGFVLDQHHVRLLTAACEAWDRAQEARETIAKEGAYYVNRFSEPRAHAAVGVERDAKATFARLVHQLNLDTPPPGSPGRPSGR